MQEKEGEGGSSLQEEWAKGINGNKKRKEKKRRGRRMMKGLFVR